jgi:hypothetical protein
MPSSGDAIEHGIHFDNENYGFTRLSIMKTKTLY